MSEKLTQAIFKTKPRGPLPSQRALADLQTIFDSRPDMTDEEMEAEYRRLYAKHEREWKAGYFNALADNLMGPPQGSA